MAFWVSGDCAALRFWRFWRMIFDSRCKGVSSPRTPTAENFERSGSSRLYGNIPMCWSLSASPVPYFYHRIRPGCCFDYYFDVSFSHQRIAATLCTNKSIGERRIPKSCSDRILQTRRRSIREPRHFDRQPGKIFEQKIQFVNPLAEVLKHEFARFLEQSVAAFFKDENRYLDVIIQRSEGNYVVKDPI